MTTYFKHWYKPGCALQIPVQKLPAHSRRSPEDGMRIVGGRGGESDPIRGMGLAYNLKMRPTKVSNVEVFYFLKIILMTLAVELWRERERDESFKSLHTESKESFL